MKLHIPLGDACLLLAWVLGTPFGRTVARGSSLARGTPALWQPRHPRAGVRAKDDACR